MASQLETPWKDALNRNYSVGNVCCVVLKELLQTNSCRGNELCWLVDSLHVPCLV